MTSRPFSRCRIGLARDVGLGDLAHGDRRLDAGLQAGLLAEVLQGQAVHDRAEHAHVVGLGAVHAGLAELGAAEEVAAAHDDGDLGALGHDLGELLGDAADDVGVDADLAAAEGLAGELEQHPVVTGCRRPAGRRWARTAVRLVSVNA